MLYFHSWSGGKDSTASIILDHIHGLPPSKIIFSEVMFDRKREISGELPEHIDFIRSKAKPLFESWGYEVEIVRAEKDYLDLFYHVTQKSKIPARNGKYSGWLIGGRCAANRDLKVAPVRNYFRKLDLTGTDYTQYIGIAIDEPKRLERLKGSNKISLLARFGFTEQMAYDLCKDYGLLSPIYDISKRGGCWFCPNQGYRELAHIKTEYPELWRELQKLNVEENVVSHGFKYGETLDQVEATIEAKINNQKYKSYENSL